MKHEWCQTIKNALHYHQMPFNIVFIVHQLLNNNVDLTEKVKMMIAKQNKQWNASENNKANQIIRPEAKEFIQNKLDNGKEYDKRKLKSNKSDMNDKDNKDVVEHKENGDCIKKHMPIDKILKYVIWK